MKLITFVYKMSRIRIFEDFMVIPGNGTGDFHSQRQNNCNYFML